MSGIPNDTNAYWRSGVNTVPKSTYGVPRSRYQRGFVDWIFEILRGLKLGNNQIAQVKIRRKDVI